jgi:hypothetical protein
LLAKASNADYDTQWVNAPNAANGIPVGGAAGEILAKIDGTDYNAEWIENFTPQVKHEVKLGEAIAKGQAVYVSSANGTNMIVSKASNATEATSSKTMGLLETGGATNDFVKVVTEGLLAGLNTSTATAGDPVWLGTSGNLIYGLASKPVAPAHLVYIGVVTRSNSNNGEIFIKPQNGFEFRELHDVLIESPADNEVMAYDNASSLWKNQTAAEAGLATASHTHAIADVTGLQTALDGKSATSHTHAIADVTGLQTALDAKVDESYEQVTTGWLTSASGFGSSTGTYTEKNGVVMVNLRATRTGSTIAAGNITNTAVMTISAGYRPLVEAAAISGPSGPLASCYISAAGSVVISALATALSNGDNLDINATYIKG